MFRHIKIDTSAKATMQYMNALITTDALDMKLFMAVMWNPFGT